MFFVKKNLDICGMDIEMTLPDAWRHFIGNLPDLKRKDKNIVRQAQRDEGRGLLGDKRRRALMERYCPGRYEFREVVVVHDGQ